MKFNSIYKYYMYLGYSDRKQKKKRKIIGGLNKKTVKKCQMYYDMGYKRSYK